MSPAIELSKIPHAVPTLADLKAKYAHLAAHGGCEESEFRALEKQIAFLAPQGAQ